MAPCPADPGAVIRKGGLIEHALYHSDALLEKLQLRRGDGCLSPVGAPELAGMLSGIDVTG